jgi:carbon storage regulator
MLILGRKVGDSILIEGGIRIVVVSVDRGSVRIGIDAPVDLKILRGEIAQQVATENQRATASPVSTAWLDALGVAPIAAPPTLVASPVVAPVAAPVAAPSVSPVAPLDAAASSMTSSDQR